MFVVRGRRPDLGFEGTIWDIPPRRARRSGTEDDLRSLAGVIADEFADEASARRRADLKATFDRI